MNKDAVMASVIGFVIGLVITAAIVYGPGITASFSGFSVPALKLPALPNFTLLKKGPDPTNTEQHNIQGESTDTTPKSLISTPLNGEISAGDSVEVTGFAAAGSTVVIQGIVDEAVSQVSQNGAYSGTVSLKEGANPIVVTVYENAKPASDTVTVYYTKEEV